MKSALWMALAVMVSPFGSVRASDAGEAASKEAVLAEIAERWSDVRQWVVDYEINDVDEGTGVRRVMAIGGPGTFAHWVGHTTPTVGWRDDPFQQSYYIRDERQYHCWPFRRTYSEESLPRGSIIPGTVYMDVILGLIPHWPLRDYRLPSRPDSQAPVLLADMLEARESMLVEGIDDVDGAPCWVFEYPGVARMWLAKDRPGCVARCDFFYAGTTETRVQFATAKSREFQPGLWLPEEMNITFFESPAAELARERRQLRMLRFAINADVKPELFAVQARPGTLRTGHGGFTEQVTPGGLELLDEVAAFARKNGQAHRVGVETILLFSGGLLAGITVVATVRRLLDTNPMLRAER